tara:strand:+ start:597 stop:815 length:219 start_codon:yes stop_codon:yes gene_type:complete
LSNNNKERTGNGDSTPRDVNAIPKRGPLPGLPNLVVSVGESPWLSREIKKIRLKRAKVSDFFREVLEDDNNG